jgi:hypothetical protein
VGAGEQVDELGLLLDQGRRLVQEDDEVLGSTAESLFEDVHHFGQAIPAVRQRDVHRPEEIQHDGAVARAPPTIDVGGPDGQLVPPTGAFEVGTEPTGERRLPAADTSRQEEMEREPLREGFAVAFREELELFLPPDQSRWQVGRVERFLLDQDAGGRRHRGGDERPRYQVRCRRGPRRWAEKGGIVSTRSATIEATSSRVGRPAATTLHRP